MADHDEALLQELAVNYDAEEHQAGVPPRVPEALSRTPMSHPTPTCYPRNVMRWRTSLHVLMSPPTRLLPVGVVADEEAEVDADREDGDEGGTFTPQTLIFTTVNSS